MGLPTVDSEEPRKVELHANTKDIDMMKKLSIALDKLNQLNIHEPTGKLFKFSLA